MVEVALDSNEELVKVTVYFNNGINISSEHPEYLESLTWNVKRSDIWRDEHFITLNNVNGSNKTVEILYHVVKMVTYEPYPENDE